MTALKEGTADLHAEAETYVRILDASASDAVYAEYLARMLGFHAPLELAFARHPGLEAAGFFAEQRTKRSLLAADLEELGVDAAAMPRCAAIPALGSLERALGVAYVIEGSTLGGKFILSRMRGHFAHLIGRATRFLDGYGDQTGARWKQFGVICERALYDDAAVAASVGGARDTFRSLIAWLARPGIPVPPLSTKLGSGGERIA